MTRPDNCPHCGVSLIGAEIPVDKQPFYNRVDAKPSDPDWVTHGRREIGIEVMGVYDGTLFYMCPDCRGCWNRWPNTPYYKDLYDAAEKAMKDPNV